MVVVTTTRAAAMNKQMAMVTNNQNVILNTVHPAQTVPETLAVLGVCKTVNVWMIVKRGVVGKGIMSDVWREQLGVATQIKMTRVVRLVNVINVVVVAMVVAMVVKMVLNHLGQLSRQHVILNNRRHAKRALSTLDALGV